jgi:hypothetical protein
MFRSALDVLDEAVCICDQTGSVLYANPAAERLMGRTGNEVPGKSHRQALSDLVSTILESNPQDLRKPYCGNIGLAGIALEYSVTSLQENGNPGNFLITLKSPGAAVPEEECASMIRKGDIDAENDLRERDRIMAGAALATNQLLISGEIGLALNQSLEILGYSANVDRAYIYEHYLEEVANTKSACATNGLVILFSPECAGPILVLCPTALCRDGLRPFRTVCPCEVKPGTSQCRQNCCSKSWACSPS